MFYTCENIIICSFSRFATFYNGDTSRGWRASGSRWQAPKEPYQAWTSFTTPFVSLPGEMDPKDKSGRKGEHVLDFEGNMVDYHSKMRHATQGLTFMNAHNQLRHRRPHTRYRAGQTQRGPRVFGSAGICYLVPVGSASGSRGSHTWSAYQLGSRIILN